MLSFGCSLGDELASLKIMYPDADIFGCDINELALTVARRNVGSFAEVFYSTPVAVLEKAPFDLIVAFSSLCVHPRPDDIAAAFSFARFGEAIALLSDCLADEGCLAVYNTAYLPHWTAAGSRLSRVRSDEICRNGFVNMFGIEHELIVEAGHSPSGQTARGVRTALDISNYDLIDCLFAKTQQGGVMRLPVRAREQNSPLLTWERSELDGFDLRERSRWIEYRRHYRGFRTDNLLKFEFDVYVQDLRGSQFNLVSRYGPIQAEAGDRL